MELIRPAYVARRPVLQYNPSLFIVPAHKDTQSGALQRQFRLYIPFLGIARP
jgi:hypothetical protein